MPVAVVNGAHINYEILEPAGGTGPSMALSPGGRNPLGDMRALGALMARAGYRVLLHDRRNCGASDVGFDASRSEFEMWADDLAALLEQLRMSPAVIGGSSSGARLALTMALRHRHAVQALLLMRITGGRFAVDRLIGKYYDSASRAAAMSGMAGVCREEHFAQVVAANPRNRDLLLAMKPDDFVACMNAWRAHFIAGIDLPLIGTSEADLRTLAIPVCIIPGNDLTHPRSRGALVAPMIPGAELHHVTDVENAIDVTPIEEWRKLYPAMASVFVDFLGRRVPRG